MTMFEENVLKEEKSDVIEGDFPLEKLLQLSESLKTGVEKNLNKFKEEKISMMNEMFDVNYTTIPEVPSKTNDESENLSIDNNEEYSDILFWKENREILGSLEQELNRVQNRLALRPDVCNEFKPQTGKDEFYKYVCSIQNKIDELRRTFNRNEIANDKSMNVEKIIQAENKHQHWMDKYNELHGKYLRLESKCVNIEKENCNFQMEIARVKMIEDENIRLHQTIDKSNHVRKQLESALESCHEVVYKYQNDAEVARNKVKEAIEVVEKTCLDKDELVENLNKSNEEIVRLENELKNVIQEAGTKVKLEVEKVKTMYKDKLRECNVEIEFLRTEKQIAVNKEQQISREYEILDKKYELINRKCMDAPDVYSKKVASLSQQIKEYEIAFDNLSASVEFLKETNMALQESYGRKKTKYTMEITFLNDKIKSLENNLNRAINEIGEDNVNILEATDKIKTLEMEISKLKRPADISEPKYTSINEFTKHIDAYKQMIDMWKIEMQNMIEGFKHKINQLKRICRKTNDKNAKLKRIINNSKANCLTCRRKIITASRKNKKPNISSMSTST